MIPVAFVGGVVSEKYLFEYINVIVPKEDGTRYTLPEVYETYREYFQDFDLTLNEDIFIIPTNEIDDVTNEIPKDKYMIGKPITKFPKVWSIRRMELEVFNILTAIDFFVEQNANIIKFYIFNLR